MLARHAAVVHRGQMESALLANLIEANAIPDSVLAGRGKRKIVAQLVAIVRKLINGLAARGIGLLAQPIDGVGIESGLRVVLRLEHQRPTRLHPPDAIG